MIPREYNSKFYNQTLYAKTSNIYPLYSSSIIATPSSLSKESAFESISCAATSLKFNKHIKDYNYENERKTILEIPKTFKKCVSLVITTFYKKYTYIISSLNAF